MNWFTTPTSQQTMWVLSCVGGSIGLLFALLAHGSIQGVLIMYVPLIALFMLGSWRGEQAIRFSLLMAVLVMLLTVSWQGALAFCLLFGWPAWLYIRLTNPFALDQQPCFHALAWLSVYAAAILAVFFSQPTMVETTMLHLSEGMIDYYVSRGAPPDQISALQSMLKNSSAFIFACVGWMWVILIQLAAALARFLLPAITAHTMPAPLLSETQPPLPSFYSWALVGTCLLALLGSMPSTRALGQVLSLMLMMPFFWLCLAHMHQELLLKQAGIWVYWLIYGLTFIFSPFSLLIFLAYGVFLQLKASLRS